ncbi:MAG TPA: amidohydrolase family protein, partial [Verrucomicrobiae bacterium]|nr:amidohydrolase family protein [Verrucomicrobiae bacterium]
MSRLLIKNATIIPMTGPEDKITGGEIGIEGSIISFVGPTGTVPQNWAPEEVIDAAGMVAMPGFVNTHTHAAMTLLRSYADDLPLMEWLSTRIWPLEEKLTADDVYWGTMLCLLEM